MTGETGRPPLPTVVVFARAPRAGEVKTRLAARVGDEAALRLYRIMGRRVVDELRDGPWRVRVDYTPADAGDEIVRWLGDHLDLRPQEGRDLGERMARSLEAALARSDRACVVGTDAPGLRRSHVARAFDALDRHDVVLGPARDGGYYLLALRRPHPSLFTDVPWSTPEVLRVTRERARALALDVLELAPLVDVDTATDVPADLRPALDAPDAPV